MSSAAPSAQARPTLIETEFSGRCRCAFLSERTPLHPLPGLGAALGLDLWVKRDDLTELGGGGNKVRKLEFLMAQAIEDGADIVLTPGSPQSNHCRLTAAAATACGLGCELFLTAPGPDFPATYHRTGNRFLFGLFGAEVHALAPQSETLRAMAQRADALRRAGRRPFIIPVGGSTATGCLGYVAAASEIGHSSFDATIVATGSGGTLAGLVVGNARRRFSDRIVGVSVGRAEGPQRDLVAGLVRQCRRLVPSADGDADADADAEKDIEIFDGARGPGYGLVDEETVGAVIRAARLDGLVLDPVYAGKAMAGLIKLAASGAFERRTRVLFWHSGGVPALFAYETDIIGERDHAQ